MNKEKEDTQEIIDKGLEAIKIHNAIMDGKEVDDKEYKKWYEWMKGMMMHG